MRLHGHRIAQASEVRMFPPFPPAYDLVLLFITELLFGFSYNQAVAWFGTRHEKLFKFLVSWSVVFGVAGTLSLQAIFCWGRTFQEWQVLLINLLCFAGSGLPMIIGSMVRASKPSHKAKRLPNNVRDSVEEVGSEMHQLASKVNEQAQANNVPAAMLIEIVHKLHEWRGVLRSL